MPFVMFDVYTAKPLGLNGQDAEALALELYRRGLTDLAGRIRYGLANNALVQLAAEEREPLVAALGALLELQPKEPEQISALAKNLRARMLGGDLTPPPVH
jgi:hypothetical protein